MITHHAFNLLLDAGIQSFCLLGAVTLLMLVLPAGSAATRHFTWLVGLTAVLLLPLSNSFGPKWRNAGWTRAIAILVRPSWGGNGNDPSYFQVSSVAEQKAPTSVNDIARRVPNAAVPAKTAIPFQSLVIWLWAAGTAACLLSFATRFLLLHRLRNRCAVPVDLQIETSLKNARSAVGLRKSVLLLTSRDDIMPMTWGTFRPVVLLPAVAAEWTDQQLQSVLRHELSHIRRRDCLTQNIAEIARAIYWFNPLAWLATARMRDERERACDDLVLKTGARPSEYAAHLLEAARRFAVTHHTPAIPVARQSGLEQRLRAIVDARRSREGLNPRTAAFVLACACAVLCLFGGSKTLAAQDPGAAAEKAKDLRDQLLTRLEIFSKEKQKQSEALAARNEGSISPIFQKFFSAAIQNDETTVTNMYVDFKNRHPQYTRKDGTEEEPNLRTSYWQPVLEICLASFDVMAGEPKYTKIYADNIIDSIPAGSIYFGGTDPGRGLITAFTKSHADGDPFFTLSQNPLADSTYLEYLQTMYGGKLYLPTTNDLSASFDSYLKDAKARLEHDTRFPNEPRRIKPGENVKLQNDAVEVSGQIAVMTINAMIAKIIFDKNQDREFYIEQSFPLEWMYPRLEPHGIILKINRQPLPELTGQIINHDQEYWKKIVAEMIGDWLSQQTAPQTVADFADRVYRQKNLSGFEGDPRFISNDDAMRLFSKERCNIADVYAWRMNHPTSVAEKERAAHAAEFAYAQAWAICPYSPEAAFGYTSILKAENRDDDAARIIETAKQIATLIVQEQPQLKGMLDSLKNQ
jgi:beta-lactamase regulating signal transducer with metallopeptidase domain